MADGREPTAPAVATGGTPWLTAWRGDTTDARLLRGRHRDEHGGAHVSGAIAAFLSIRREFIGRPLEVKKIFLSSAIPLGRERYFEGHGLLDLMKAIQSV